MSFLESFFLGVLQGVAEFLPISSSGHLAVAKAFLSLSDVSILYDVILHLATLCAILVVYRKTIWRLLCVTGRFIVRKSTTSDKTDLSFILAIIVATFITGVLGFLLKDLVENLPVKIIAILFIVTGILLLLADKTQKSENSKDTISLKSACIVGLVQGLAVLPGISRSGSTISAGLFSGIKRSVVAEFSFILSIPAILGALILELFTENIYTLNVGFAELATGFITAFVVGLISLKLLTHLLKKANLKVFSFYLIPLGIILFCYFQFF